MQWSVDRMMDLATGYWRSAALSAGVELGLFDVLDRGNRSGDELATQLEVAPLYLEPLLDALASLGLLHKQDGTYGIAPQASRFLCRSSPECLLDALRMNLDLYPLWGRLANSIREGRPAVPPGAHLGHDSERTRRFVRAMHSRATAIAPAFLPAVDIRGISRLLDLGAGPGTFSCLLAERHSELRVTLYDLPPILQIAREIVQTHPAASRLAFHPGNYRNDDLPAGHDAVLYCGALHQESAPDAARLMRRIFQTLPPGGRLFVVDLMVDEDRTSPAFSALFSLTMMLTSPAGRVHSEQQVRHLLTDAGFDEISCHRTADSPYRVVAGSKSRHADALRHATELEVPHGV